MSAHQKNGKIMDSVNKVYCNNCKFFSKYLNYLNDGVFIESELYNDCKNGKDYKRISRPEKQVTISSGGYLTSNKNSDNACRDYKTKWWKFWVKR